MRLSFANLYRRLWRVEPVPQLLEELARIRVAPRIAKPLSSRAKAKAQAKAAVAASAATSALPTVAGAQVNGVSELPPAVPALPAPATGSLAPAVPGIVSAPAGLPDSTASADDAVNAAVAAALGDYDSVIKSMLGEDLSNFGGADAGTSVPAAGNGTGGLDTGLNFTDFGTATSQDLTGFDDIQALLGAPPSLSAGDEATGGMANPVGLTFNYTEIRGMADQLTANDAAAMAEAQAKGMSIKPPGKLTVRGAGGGG